MPRAKDQVMVLALALVGCGPGNVGASGSESGSASQTDTGVDAETETGPETETETSSETETETETGQPACGDGSLDEGEACDDGNLDSGDGCSDACELEPGGFVRSIAFDVPVSPTALGVLGPSTPGGQRRLAVVGADLIPDAQYDLIIQALELDGSSSWIVDSPDDDASSISLSADYVASSSGGGLVLVGNRVETFITEGYDTHAWFGVLEPDGSWQWSLILPMWDRCRGLVVRPDDTIVSACSDIAANYGVMLSPDGNPLGVGSAWGEGLSVQAMAELSNGELVASAFSGLPGPWNPNDPPPPLPPPDALRVFHLDDAGEPLAAWSQDSPNDPKVRSGELLVQADQLLIVAAAYAQDITSTDLVWVGAAPDGPQASWWSEWPEPSGTAFQADAHIVAHPDGGAWIVAQTTQQDIVLSRWLPNTAAPSRWTPGLAGWLVDAVALPEEGLLAVLIATAQDRRIDLYLL